MELVDPRSNIFRRPGKLGQGETCRGHTHNFYHTTYVPEGGVRIRAAAPDGSIRERDVFPGDSVGIEAGDTHSLTGIGNLPAIARMTRLVRAPLLAALARADCGPPMAAVLRDVLAGVDAQIAHFAQVNRFDCIYSHRTPQGAVIQHYDGWWEANI